MRLSWVEPRSIWVKLDWVKVRSVLVGSGRAQVKMDRDKPRLTWI